MQKRQGIIENGSVFARLTVVGLAEKPEGVTHAGRYYSCRCECGNTEVVRGDCLRSGQKQSCGCLMMESSQRGGLIHGESGTKLYSVRQNMLMRCYVEANPGYANYGGRGITVCQEWRDDYVAFAEWARSNGYIEGLDIDRIDNNAGYRPDNCRWVTRKVNLRNRRNNITLTAFGETKCLTDWMLDPRCNVTLKTLKYRIENGLTPEAAIATPSQQGKILSR